MLAGPISGTVDILTNLNSRRVPLYALSNWSVETFPAALKRFEFLKCFRAVMLSGEVQLVKPDPRIFKLFLETFAIDPAVTVYVDDREPNVKAATACGMHGILFTDAPALQTELIGLGLLD
jgi:2-haloacid dehalogenase